MHGDVFGHGSTLRDYLHVVRRRKWVILAALVLVPLAAVLFSRHQPKKYEASAQVLLSRQNLSNALTGTVDPTVYLQPDWLTQTQADVARVPTVAARALTISGVRGRSIDDVLAEASVVPRPNTDVLVFKVIDRDPGIARRLATAYAKAYTAYRSELDTTATTRALVAVRARIQALARAHLQQSALYRSLVGREQQLATLQAAQTSNAYVIQEAASGGLVQPKPTRNGILGLGLGLVLGVGLAFLWEALDTRVRTSDEISRRLGGLPLLARLPEPPRKLRTNDRLVMLDEPSGPQAESFRMLRTNLEFARLSHNARTIMVTSAVDQEGKSTTIANLAVAVARSGARVVLVDLDLRRPYLHRFFDLEGPGLTQVAIGYADLQDAIHPIALTELNPLSAADANGNGKGRAPAAGMLEVLPSGPTPPDPGEFVSTERLAALLAQLRSRADIVLIDAPPMLHVGDALTLSANVDAIMVVTRMNILRRPMLNELHRLLKTSPAHSLGFIVTGAGVDEGYGYGYGYGYTARPYSPPEESLSPEAEAVQ